MADLAADRDLLFGLLALQNGLVDRSQLVAGFQAWILNKSRPLADHLVARGDLDEGQRGVVAALADLHVQKHGGSTEESLASIAAAPSTRQSLAQLGDPDVYATLAYVGPGSDETRSDGSTDGTTHYAVGTATSRGQRFHVLRPHASGGLGAVFVRGMPSSTARWHSSKFSTTTPMTLPADDGFFKRPKSTADWSTPASSRSTGSVNTPTAARTTPCGLSAAIASRRPSRRSTPTLP